MSAEGKGLKQIIPVNMAQIGLVVSGKVSVDISYRYGLFSGTQCRRDDLDRIRDLDLARAAEGRLFLNPADL